MNRLRNNKGFTLVEMLVVVAIIAVLVGIALAVFGSSFEKARETTDAANIRMQYSQVMAKSIGSGDADIVNENGEDFGKINLKQTTSEWQTTELKENLESLFTDSEGVNIEGEGPNDGGTAWVEYDSLSQKVVLHYDGQGSGSSQTATSSYDYVLNLGSAVTAQKLNVKNSPCVNSTCKGNGTINGLLNNLSDKQTKDDIKSWAAVSNADGTSTGYSYIYSTVDINSVSVGTKVPAVFVDSSGNYSVGYATVSAAPDRASNSTNYYQVMTVTSDGTYGYTYDASYKGTKNNNYKPSSDNLLEDKEDYGTNRDAAQAAYDALMSEYNNN